MKVMAWALWAAVLPAFGHGGGLNADGCHHNRKTGDYHCHRAPAVSPRPPEQQASAASFHAQGQPGHVTQATSTCYTGPRGGTYTITASGRKNYGGC